MISIVVIVYNVENYVRQCIESVLNQTYRDLEIILVVGHGTDASEEICKEYAAKDARIKLICCPAKGEADARNRGIEQVSGDYLGFVDSDDFVEPQMFERMLDNIKKYDADIAVCGRFYEYVNDTLSDTANDPVVLTASQALAVTLGHEGFYLHCWDKLYSRKIFEGLHFTPGFAVEDRIVVDRLLSKADRVVYDPTPMYHYRERYGSGSQIKSGMVRNNVEANLLMEEFIMKEHPELANEINAYMLYESITAVQNEMMCERPDRQELAQYKDKIRQLSKVKNPLVGRTLKIKTLMALYTPHLLAAYTKRHKNSVSEKLEKFP